jgi:hypothetical protein
MTATNCSSLAERLAELGDPIIGYQASMPSKVAQALRPAMPFPWVGTLLAPVYVGSGGEATLRFARFGRYNLEAEIGMLMGTELSGPNSTATTARGSARFA